MEDSADHRCPGGWAMPHDVAELTARRYLGAARLVLDAIERGELRCSEPALFFVAGWSQMALEIIMAEAA